MPPDDRANAPAASPALETQASDAGARESESTTHSGATGLGRVARRVSVWTSNLLITAIIVMVALMFGGKLTEFWRFEETSPAELSPYTQTADPFFSDSSAPLALRFGQSPLVIHRQVVYGTHNEAFGQLCQACSSHAAEAKSPDGPPGEAEAALLRNLADRRPLREASDGSGLYQVDNSLPMVVAVRGGDGRGESSENAGFGGGDGESSRRVVTWGLAVPNVQNGWTLYRFEPGGIRAEGAGENSESRGVGLPTPPGSAHLLSLRLADGGSVTTFRGTGGPENWSTFYDNWFGRHRWRAEIPWRLGEESCRARFRSADADAMVDIIFRRGTTVDKTKKNAQPVAIWRGAMTLTRLDGSRR